MSVHGWRSRESRSTPDDVCGLATERARASERSSRWLAHVGLARQLPARGEQSEARGDRSGPDDLRFQAILRGRIVSPFFSQLDHIWPGKVYIAEDSSNPTRLIWKGKKNYLDPM
jgi:hypothetical protein